MPFKRKAKCQDSLEEERLITINGKCVVVNRPTPPGARRRKRTTLSRMTVLSEDKGDEVLRDHAAKFAPQSTANQTWGITATGPIVAPILMRRSNGRKATGPRTTFEQFIMGQAFGEPMSFVENKPKKRKFLDFPPEIRQMIYRLVLVQEMPVVVRTDWTTVRMVNLRDHNLLLICKQITKEATPLIYEANIFCVVLNKVSKCLSDPQKIDIKYVPHFRNVMIECLGTEAGAAYLPLAKRSMGNLIRAGTNLRSMTVIITSDSTLLATQLHQIKTFQALFAVQQGSNLMSVLVKARCRVLNIILKHKNRKDVVVSVDLSCLSSVEDKTKFVIQDKAAKLYRRVLERSVRHQIIRLGRTLEEVASDPEKAVMEGKARFMRSSEKESDGAALANFFPRKIYNTIKMAKVHDSRPREREKALYRILVGKPGSASQFRWLCGERARCDVVHLLKLPL